MVLLPLICLENSCLFSLSWLIQLRLWLVSLVTCLGLLCLASVWMLLLMKQGVVCRTWFLLGNVLVSPPPPWT